MTRIAPLIILLAAGLFGLVASAQDKPAGKKKATGSAAAGAAPRPAPEMKELRELIGTWSIDEAFEPSPMAPNSGTGTGTVTARLGPGGFTVLLDLQDKTTMGASRGHGMFTWDPTEKVYAFVYVDSVTPGFQILTGHKEGDSLVFTAEPMLMGKKVTVKDVIGDRTPTSYTFTSYMNDGSGEKKAFTIKFTKQESPAPKK
jgi:hypothetical protein